LSSAIGVIQGFHAIIGGLRQEPHWFLNDADAQRYGQAMANAARHFPLKTTQKAIDVSMLIIVAFSVETPRIVLSIQKARQPAPVMRGPAQVFQFHPPQQAQPTPAAPTTPQSPGGDGQAPPDVAEGPPDYGAFGGEAPS
jgi:hypothetical protein